MKKGIPECRAKAGIDAGQLFHSIVLGRLLVLEAISLKWGSGIIINGPLISW